MEEGTVFLLQGVPPGAALASSLPCSGSACCTGLSGCVAGRCCAVTMPVHLRL